MSGGGIYKSETTTLLDTVFTGNTASSNGGSGGGIYNHHGSVHLVNSTVSGNVAASGGGITNLFRSATQTLAYCSFALSVVFSPASFGCLT